MLSVVDLWQMRSGAESEQRSAFRFFYKLCLIGGSNEKCFQCSRHYHAWPVSTCWFGWCHRSLEKDLRWLVVLVTFSLRRRIWFLFLVPSSSALPAVSQVLLSAKFWMTNFFSEVFNGRHSDCGCRCCGGSIERCYPRLVTVGLSTSFMEGAMIIDIIKIILGDDWPFVR